MPSRNLPRSGQIHTGFNLPSGPWSSQQYRFALMMLNLLSEVYFFPGSSSRENDAYSYLVMRGIYFQVHLNGVFEQK